MRDERRPVDPIARQGFSLTLVPRYPYLPPRTRFLWLFTLFPSFAGACGEASDARFTSDRGASEGTAAGGDGGAAMASRADAATSSGAGSGVIRFTDAAAGETECDALRAKVRDFSLRHPDFEDVVNGRVVRGLVESTLGANAKPVVVTSLAMQSGIHRFEEWYRDQSGVNHPFEVEIPLAGSSGTFVFDSNAFFPIDGKGFGNEYQSHNFHFTTEIHTRFMYRKGDRFTFAGDDDLWLFINGRLALDLGGVHARSSETVDLDQRAGELGIEVGKSYSMDIFHAERHTGDSNFRIETTIDCFEDVFVQ